MRYRHKAGNRRGVRVLAATCATVLAAAMLVVLNPAPPASAASYTFLVDSLAPIGNDLNPGDGICRTSTNTCTLRAALQESNALGALNAGHQVTISPAADVDSSTPGVQTSGTIVGNGPVNTTNFMFVGTLTNQGDAGAYFMATQPVTLDFQNRLGMSSLNDSYGATGIYINGPDVSVRNFNNIKTNETSFVVGAAGDRAMIENGSITDAGSANAERAVWIADGVDDLTIRRVVFNSLWDGGPGAIMFAPSAQVNNLTIDQITMQNTDGDAYDGIISAGGATTRPVLTNMTITNSTFTQFPNAARPLMLNDIDLSGALITGNTFKGNSYGAYAAIYWNRASVGTPNVISRNTFDESGPGATSYGIYIDASPRLTASTSSGWRIEDNYFDGFSTNAVFLAYSGITTVQRNRFGVNNASAGTNTEVAYVPTSTGLAVDEETRHWGFFYNFWTAPFSNDRVRTWYPTSVTTDSLACTATVTITPPTVLKPTAIAYDSTLPTTPVTIDVYYTSIANGTNAYAEVYLGRQTGISGTAAQNVTVPYTLGPGYLRVQTIDSTGKSSQYSRVVPQTAPDTCGPRVAVEQAVVQNDPAVQRDLLFTVTTSEPLAASGTGALAIGDFSLAGSSAPNPRVTAVTKTSETTYRVTARADGAGTVQLSLPGGTIADGIGNLSAPSTSVDNVVTYVSPLSVDPASVTVTEGGATTSYTITNTVAATAPISIAPTSANPAWATVAPSPLVMATTATTVQGTVSAVDDTIVNGTRNTTLAHAVTSADLEFDGLVLSPVPVQINDNDTPSATLSTLATTAGIVVADGVSTHTATVTARNADGTPVQGATVQFNGAAELLLSNTTCTTGATGVCSITVASTEFGTFGLTARIAGIQITGSPGPLEFGAGPPTAEDSTISASLTTIVGDGTSPSEITVTAYDALGNPVSVGGATVTMATTLGTLGPVTDNGDGTYSAVLTAPTALGTATVSFTMNSVASPNTATVTFIAGPASPARSTIAASPTSITANGVTTSTVTVRLLDGLDNPTTGGPVEMESDIGTLSAVTDNGDGTFTATLTSATTAGTATISFAIDGAPATAQAEVDFVPGPAAPGSSTISAVPTTVTADGSSTSLVTVQLVDAFGNPVRTGGPVVTMASSSGSLGAVSDNDDGTYTAVLTAPTTPGLATVTFEIGGNAGTAQATVTFTPGAPSAGTSQIAITPTTMPADGSSTGTVTVTLRDSLGNLVGAGGADVAMEATVGEVGPVTDNGDGTYSATYTAGTVAGPDAVVFTVGDVPASARADVTLTAGVASAGTSTIAAFPNSIEADGTSTSLLTVTLLDAFGNALVAGGDTVAIQTTTGSVGPVTDKGNGTYTATLTSSTVIGSATVSFTVNGSSATDTQTVIFRAGAPSLTNSTIEATPTAITADGVATSTVTVRLRDGNDNALTASGGTVVIRTSAGTVTPTVDNGDGTYTATLTAGTVSGPATLDFTIEGSSATETTVVDLQPGALDLDRSTIGADQTSLPAGGFSTTTVTVRLTDAFGNLLGVGGPTVEMSATAGTLGSVTDNGDGTYSAELTSSELATSSEISYTVDGQPGTATLTIVFTAGEASPSTSTISAAPTSITANGTSTSTVTVTTRDAYDNLVTSGATVVITTDVGTISGVTDNGDGTHTATLTAPTAAGTALLRYTVNTLAGGAEASVQFVAGAPDATTSQIVASPTSITADGISTSAITVSLLDAFGNPVRVGGATVVISSDNGTFTSTTDNGDGTYSATLTSATTAGSATVSFNVNSSPGTATASVAFVAGAPSAATSQIAAAPTSITADGTSTSTVTVTLRDAQGNLVTGAGDVVAMSTTAGSLGAVTDHGDGTYTAALTSATTAGAATVSFTVGASAGVSTASVAFVAGAADATTSQIAASPTSITADGTSTSTVTVTLLDANGNLVTGAGDVVAMSTTAGSLGAVTNNADGTYTATLTSATTAGTATVSFTVDGVDATATATVAFVAGAADATTSQIAASPTSIIANGTSTSTVTVTLLDANGNLVATAGDVVAMSTTAGSLGAVTNNADGTYSATLTSVTTAGTATVSFTVGGSPGTATATVSFVAGAPSAGTSQIAAAPTSVTADGTATSTVTVTLLDANGNLVTGAGDVVAMSTTAGSLGAVTNNADGTYTATLTSATTAGTATVSFTVSGSPGTATATVSFVAGAPSAGTSQIAAAPTSIIANGTSTSTVTVTLRDANGNLLTTGGATVGITSNIGSVGGVTDNGDGTYTAQLTSTTAVGTATVSFTVGGSPGTATATVNFVAGAPSTSASLIVATPLEITADGTSTSDVKVTLLDALGNPVTGGGDTVAMSTTAGSLGAVTPIGDGVYVAELTSTTVAGTIATLSFSVNGSSATPTASVKFVAGAASTAESTISVSSPSITADGVSTSTVTVTLLDAYDNPLGIGGATVGITANLGTVGPVTDNGNGTYTATLTSATTAGTATVSFTIGASAGASTATVAFVAGAADATTSEIAASPTSITADGTSTSTVTVTLLDAEGNLVTTAGDVVAMSADVGSLGAVTDVGDGTYTATLTSATTAGTATVSFTVDGVDGTATATVAFVAGAADATTSEIAAAPTSIIANGTSTSTVTVTLRDAEGNLVTTAGDVVGMSTTAGSLGAVTDVGDGTYTATLTSATTAGTATVSFTVDGVDGTATATVNFVAGAPSAGTSEIAAAPTSIIANGTSTSTVTVTLRDAQGNLVTDAGAVVAMSADVGSLSAVTDNTDGTYTATLTSATTAGTATVSFTVNATAGTATATVNFVAGAPSAGTSQIAAAPTSITADGTSTSTVTVTLRDANGNLVTDAGAVVGMSADVGSLSAVTDNTDGTYTATLTSATTAGTATVSFTVNASPGTATATVAFVAGAPSATTSQIAAAPTSITADGTSTSTVTVTLRDANGNPLTSGGQTVTMSTTAGGLGAVTDNTDGTYTATLTSATTAGTATVSFTVGGSPGTATATVSFVAGAPSTTTSQITAAPTSITADGTSTSTVTVTLRDANGNLVTGAGDVVGMSTTAGSLGGVTNNTDGTYTATLTSATTAGTATLSFTVSASPGTATATVQFVAGAVDATTSLIAAAPTSITADGVSTSTVTVTLRDANGNPLTSGGQTVAMSTTAGSLDAVSDNGNGTYTAQLTSATAAGDATVSFTVNSVAGGQSVVVRFVPGQWDPSTSRISAAATDIVADGVSTSLVTVTLEDAQGNQLNVGGSTVVISTTRGTISGVTDNGNGTYSATLTSATVAGAATLSFTVDSQAGTDTVVVLMVPGAASATLSTIDAAPTTVNADGTSTSTVTVQLVDAQGNALTTSGGTVVVQTTAGVLTPAVDNGNGTYTATLTAPTVLATATLTFSVSGSAATDTATVSFVPGPLSVADSTIQSSVTELQADLSSTATITVTARDAQGNPRGVSAGPVTMSTTAGTLGLVTDNGDGTYTATLTAPDLVAVAVVTFTMNGTAGTSSATVTFVPGVASPSSSTIAAAPASIVANGSSTSTVTVTLIDGPGNPLTSGGDTVTMSTTGGSLGAVTDNGDGTYTATLTSATSVGTAVVSFTVNGADASRTASVEFTPGPADAGQAQIVASPGSLVVNSGQTSAVTVILRDAYGNRVLTGGADVSVSTSQSVLTSVADNGDGTYTATLLADSVPGTAVLNFTVEGVPGTATASVDMVIGPPNAAQSTISAAPTTIESDGSSTSTVTVQLVDAFGNALTTGGPVVGMSTTAGTLSAVTDNGDGTYTAQLTSATAPAVATVSFTLDTVAGAASTQVRFQDTTPPPPPTITGPSAGATVNVVATFTGTGEPGARITVTDSTGRDLCSATVDASGQWSCTPAFRLTPGPLTFSVTQTDASGNTSAVGSPITIEVVGPALTIDVAQLQRGQQQSVTGTGFIPGEVVAGLVQSTPIDLGTVIADAQGTVTFTFVVPADFEIGMHTITLTGELSGPVAGTFEVVASPPAPTPAPVLPVLPRTGAEGWIPAAVLSGFALLLGAMLLVWRRRRSRRELFGRFGI